MECDATRKSNAGWFLKKLLTMHTQTVKIKTKEENPEPLELIAQSIIELAEAGRKMQSTRLNQRAILILLKDATGLGMREIEIVLNAVSKLDTHFIKQLKSKS